MTSKRDSSVVTYKIKSHNTMQHLNKFLFFVAIFSFSSFTIAKDNVLPPKAKLLIEYYEKARKETDSIKYCRQFFEIYPSTWNEFHSLYRFSEKYDPKNNNYGYLSGRIDVLYFFKTIKCVDKKLFYTKLINVSVGGKWEADNIGIFQNELHKFIFKEPQLTVSILSNLSDRQVIDFFFFFFYAIHPPFAWIPEELEPAVKNKKRISNLMNEGFNLAIKMSGHH